MPNTEHKGAVQDHGFLVAAEFPEGARQVAHAARKTGVVGRQNTLVERDHFLVQRQGFTEAVAFKV